MLTASKNEKMFLNVFENPENLDFKIKLTNFYNGSEIHSVTVTNASKFSISLCFIEVFELDAKLFLSSCETAQH